MVSLFAVALVLTLDPSPQADKPLAAPAAAVANHAEQDAPALRSTLWVPAGGYGMGAMFGGAAGILVEYSTRKIDNSRNVKAPLLSLGGAFLGGLLPGLLLGESARASDNEKARGAVGILDVAGSAAMFYALTQIFRSK